MDCGTAVLAAAERVGASGFRRPTTRYAANPDPRGRTPSGTAADERLYCPTCLHRVPATRTTRHLHLEVCASGTIPVWLSRCPTCGLTLAAQVAEVAYVDYAGA